MKKHIIRPILIISCICLNFISYVADASEVPSVLTGQEQALRPLPTLAEAIAILRERGEIGPHITDEEIASNDTIQVRIFRAPHNGIGIGVDILCYSTSSEE